MKTKTLYILLTIFAAVCVVIGALGVSGAAAAGIMAFPFEQLGLGLRWLSMSGGVGNIAAIVLYAAICLLPAIWVLLRSRRRGFCNADWLTLLLSLVLFGVLYLMINPGLLANTALGAAGVTLMKACLGGCCWSVVVAWAVLALLGHGREGGREQTQRYLSLMLTVLAFVFVAAAFGGGTADFTASVEALRQGNTMPGLDLAPTMAFLALRAIAGALPYVLDALVSLKAAELLSAMGEERYGEETLAKAEGLSRLCVLSLKITVIVSLVINILQLLFAEALLVLSVNVVIPLTSIAFVLLTLLLLGFMRENKALKDDNDLFI